MWKNKMYFGIKFVPCSSERLFSVLQRPKTNLWTIMEQDHLGHLGVLYIECAYVNKVAWDTNNLAGKRMRSSKAQSTQTGVLTTDLSSLCLKKYLQR